MSTKHILLILANPQTGQLLERAILTPAGYRVTLATEWKTAHKILKNDSPNLVILSDTLEGNSTLEVCKGLMHAYPLLPFILLPEKSSNDLVITALRSGFDDYLPPPLKAQDIQASVQRVLEKHSQTEEQIRLAARQDTNTLRTRVNGLETIHRVGQQVTSLLELDEVLTAVVDAAVDLTGAEEGSLLLIDETSGELYMRAGRNFQEDFVRTFRLPIRDSLAGQVLRTGKPLLIDEKTPQKIKTSYLVYTILYVPLIVKERVIGVLEVDNRNTHKPFSEYHVALISALANYAAIAIENAQLYSHSEGERNKLETILANIDEGVIVIDHDGRVLLINRKAREAFGVEAENWSGKRLREVVEHQDLLEIIREHSLATSSQVEVSLKDGRVLNAQITPIPEIGVALTMQDITHLKDLDRIKSDFVNTVSHDLRSPLTAILGYVELIDRVGPINDQQREFVRRVQTSVHNITALINDLLDLGRIEAGFDARKEVVPFSGIIHFTVEGLRSRAEDKELELAIEVPESLPHVLGNPVRLKQMLNNLLNNAIKYTPQGGKVRLYAQAQANQIILQVQDNGPGIPPADQPYIFDKFYRASNISYETPGTGLGLAIVKSIIDNHLGRVWVESMVGQGTTFTIVLPTSDPEL
jgi:two-component system NtrC family sensor kinase